MLPCIAPQLGSPGLKSSLAVQQFVVPAVQAGFLPPQLTFPSRPFGFWTSFAPLGNRSSTGLMLCLNARRQTIV